MAATEPGERDRLTSLFGALVSSADAVSGFHPEKAIRTAVVATRLAEAHGLPPAAAADAYYLALVRFLGCTAFAPEAARYGGGDDISVGAVMGLADPAEPLQSVRGIISGVDRGTPPPRRFQGVSSCSPTAPRPASNAAAECDVVMLVVVRAPIRTFGPEGTLDRAAQGDDLARFVVDTWTFFGLEMLAVGVVLLLATRWGQLASGAIATVLAIEVSRGIVADLSQVVRGVHVGGYAVWILIHSVVLLTGAHCLRDARRHADGPVAARSGSAAAAQA